jgi:hypothetical protein
MTLTFCEAKCRRSPEWQHRSPGFHVSIRRQSAEIIKSHYEARKRQTHKVITECQIKTFFLLPTLPRQLIVRLCIQLSVDISPLIDYYSFNGYQIISSALMATTVYPHRVMAGRNIIFY